MNRINTPNKLTILRVIMVPLCMFFILVPVFGDTASRITAAVLFATASITDFIDGKMARKYGLVTDFGKLMDPLADKFLVIGALLAITAAYQDVRWYVVWATAIVFFRELGITSLRLVANSSDGIVIAANKSGKLKTGFQCAAIISLLLEPVIAGAIPTPLFTNGIVSIVLVAVMCVLTIYSGGVYVKAYWPYLDPSK